ncbi:MAG: aldehyde dehydrogenase family protein [Acidimicrobiia bacterium]
MADAAATLMEERRSYVAGKWVDGDGELAVENPADEQVFAAVSTTPLSEVERSILEAKRSFDDGVWADTPPLERARVVNAMLDYISSQRSQLAATIVAEAGQPRGFAEFGQVVGGVAQARDYIKLYLSLPEEEPNPVPLDELVNGRVALSFRHYEPIGVVTAITPFNATMLMGFQKIVPALMAGNSVILRPSPLTPISSLIFASAAEAAGLPAGVFSVIVEEGAAGAELLTSHPAIDMISFTGSTTVAKAILVQAAATIKRVALELGGKSAQIYLPDALDRAAAGAAGAIGAMAGQACVAATRMLVPIESKDQVIDAATKALANFNVGDPNDPKTTMGPVISAAQRARCEKYVSLAQEHGGKVAIGGGRTSTMGSGYYFDPTVLDLPDNSNPAAQDEIFGPVVSVLGYRDLDDAVRIANDSVYGLSGQVYGHDVKTATNLARRLRTGAVNVNTGVFSAYASSGGYKQSGLGRERGPEGIRAFQQMKHLAIGELK